MRILAMSLTRVVKTGGPEHQVWRVLREPAYNPRVIPNYKAGWSLLASHL
jgi:hypothetical protein